MPSKNTAELHSKAALYGMFSAALREPVSNPPAAEEFSAAWKSLALKPAALPEPPEDMEDERRRVFGHNLSPDCPPYETHYGRMGVFRKTHTLADLAGFYKAFGVELAAGDRRSDHLPVELEFASLLLHKELLAIENGDVEKIAICRKARAKFLHDHLAVWVPIFAKAVARKKTGGYFDALTRLLAAFVAFDANSLAAAPGPAAAQTAAAIEEADASCMSCFGGGDEKV